MSLKDSIVPNEIKTIKDISIVIESESTDQADLKTENNIMSTLAIQTKVTITKSEVLNNYSQKLFLKNFSLKKRSK